MSSIRLNISDAERAINGEVHGCFGDAVVAALTAEPETIDELGLALARFIKPLSDLSPFAWLQQGESFEPYDAGVVVIDLAARIVAVDSSYSQPSAEGNVRIEDESSADEVFIPYRLSDDWLFVYSMPEYEGVSAKRRAERLAFKPLDVREVLYGRALLEFIARELFAARNSDDEGLFTEIHAKWLMTTREDLRDKTPREILLAKQDFIDFDLHSRSLQWSFTGACPPPLPLGSNAYARAGFGTHEIVVYYELVRYLLAECFTRLRAEKEFSLNATVEYLEQLKAAWLAAPNRDFSGRTPGQIIEWERQRVNLTMSATEYVIDEDCDLCQAMAEDFDTPTFWHLDGCNMDDRFEFSFHKTRAEFEAERKQWEEFNQEFDRDWKEGKYDKPFDESQIWFDDDENLIQ
ncbi:MAG: hypothetical protein DMF64_00190 [Acidobacteria bacterium]|nr:MAG: hypothetical protein DMF64_00190 [Acidobacteriota bacterium]